MIQPPNPQCCFNYFGFLGPGTPMENKFFRNGKGKDKDFFEKDFNNEKEEENASPEARELRDTPEKGTKIQRLKRMETDGREGHRKPGQTHRKSRKIEGKINKNQGKPWQTCGK